ncbi:MAG: metallopeptidase family protein [Candidatus Gracilibacteria bacterium]
MTEHQQTELAHIETLVDTAFEEILEKESPAFRDMIKRTHIRVLWDSPEHDRYGDFFGVSLAASDGSNLTPPDIVVYARPIIEQFGLHGNHVMEQITKTLMHEIGHYLGLDHPALKERGWA